MAPDQQGGPAELLYSAFGEYGTGTIQCSVFYFLCSVEFWPEFLADHLLVQEVVHCLKDLLQGSGCKDSASHNSHS